MLRFTFIPVLLFSIQLSAAPLPATRPATVPAVRPTSRPTQESIDLAILQAHNLIAAAQYDDAVKLLDPLFKFAPNNPRLNLALGYCLLKLGKPKAAIPKLEIAYAAEPPVRTLVLALASALQTENPMRAARILKDYLADTAHPIDEELQNALGSVLNQAADDPKINREFFFDECRRFYMAYEDRLNEHRAAGKPRVQKHWGAQWIDAADAEEKWKKVIAAEKRASETSRNAELATRTTAKAKDNLQIMHNGFGLYSTRDRRRAADDYKAAVATEERAHAAFEKAQEALDKTDKPPFEKKVPTPPFWQKE
jgi:tetratricopeptide (TPR) repeat protein